MVGDVSRRVGNIPQRWNCGQGLAYSVSGGFNTSAFDHKGLFIAGGETAAVGDFISALERVLQVAVSCGHLFQSLIEACRESHRLRNARNKTCSLKSLLACNNLA